MALGKLESIDPKDAQYGTVIESETEDRYNYHDPLFREKGINVGDAITFTISYEEKNPVATDLQKYVPTERVIEGNVSGPVSTQPGETLRVKKGGKINGSVIISNNSCLYVEDDGTIDGEVTVGDGSNATIRKGGQIKGNVNINNGSLLRVVNKGTVKGNIIFNSGNKLIIGNANGGGTVNGEIITDKIKKLSITAQSVING